MVGRTVNSRGLGDKPVEFVTHSYSTGREQSAPDELQRAIGVEMPYVFEPSFISRPKMYVRLHTCGAYGWCIQKVLPFQKAVYLFLCMPGTYAWVARERMRQVPLKKVVDLHAHWVYLQCMQKYVEPVQEPVLSTDSN